MQQVYRLASVTAVKAWRVPRRAGMSGQSGHRARPSLAGRRGKLAQGPTQHNGRSHVAGPQAAAKALLGGPAARDPRYVLRPLPCARGQLSRGVVLAARLQSFSQRGIGCAETAECSGQALARSLWCWPPPTRCGPGALRLWPSAGLWPVRPPRGLPATPARGWVSLRCMPWPTISTAKTQQPCTALTRRASSPAAKKKSAGALPLVAACLRPHRAECASRKKISPTHASHPAKSLPNPHQA